MRTLYWRLLAVAVAAGGVSACGSSGSTTAAPPPVVTPAAKLEDQFGTNFGIAFRNNPNTDATDPAPGDIIPLSLTTDPVAI